MVEVNPAGWFQALATHTAEQLRTYVGNAFAVPQGVNSLKTLGAVHPALGTAMAVTQNGTPNMTVNVGAGSCWISGTETTKQGTYFCQNDAVKNLTITASDPTLNRIDLVVAKVQDAQYSGSVNAWSLVMVNGTAAGSPVAPAAPANSITLAQITVSAGVTSITSGAITDTRPWNAALGGIVPATSTVRPANPYNGLYAHELDTFRTIRYNGTNWHQVGIHICTNATRPAGPYTGMKIYETDTGLEYQWTGSAWSPPPGKMLAYASRNTNTANFTAGEQGVLRLDNIPVIANHRYWTAFSFSFYAATTGDYVSGKLRFSTSGVATTSSTVFGTNPQVRSENFTANGSSVSGSILAAATGTMSVLFSLVKVTGTGNLSTSGFIEMPFFDAGLDPTSTAVVL